MIIVGIDPGIHGGIAHIQGEYCAISNMPIDDNGRVSAHWLDGYIRALHVQSREVYAVLEKSQAMPGQGVVSMFNYGVNYGILFGVFSAYLDPGHVIEVYPRTWKKAMGLSQNKIESVNMAEKLFPAMAFRSSRGKLLDGRAESILIAEYYRRCKNGNECI